jgi:predicted outer membrane repeat protein
LNPFIAIIRNNASSISPFSQGGKMQKYLLALRTWLLIFSALLATGFTNQDAHAAGVVGNGSPASCTETALVAALAGGGAVTFKCGGAVTIPISNSISINQDTTLYGGGNVTLNGGGTTRIFLVVAQTNLTLNDIILDNGNAGNQDGGAIEGSGTIVLSNVTIQNSKTNKGFCGGAIATDSTGTTIISNSTFQQDTAGSGGVICTSGSLDITSSHFLFNSATNTISGSGGGAIYLFPGAKMVFKAGELNGNSALSGGGIYLTGNAQVSFYSNGQPVSFAANNVADSGGAIYVDPSDVSGYLNIDNANFTGNSAPQNTPSLGYGGAIAYRGASPMTISNSFFSKNQSRFGGAVFVGNGVNGVNASINHTIFDQNQSTLFGGGLYTNGDNTHLHVSDAVFTRNQSAAGGGVARFNAVLSVSDSSFTNNTATQFGGGILVAAGPTPDVGGYVEIRDSTIAANTAPQGGGVYNSAEVDLGNITLVSNTNGLFSSGSGVISRLYNTVLQNPSSLNCDGTGVTPSSAGGNFSTDNSCNLNLSTDKQGIGLDPMLGSLTNDGPNTTDYELPLAGSPLINHAVPPCSTTDQRHATRPDTCDIGAVEYHGVVPPKGITYIPFIMR